MTRIDKGAFRPPCFYYGLETELFEMFGARHLERWIKAERLVFLFHPLRGLHVDTKKMGFLFLLYPLRGLFVPMA